MDGCKDRKLEIVFFDDIFGSVMKLIDFDTKLQKEIEYHLQTEEDLSNNITDYNDDTIKLRDSYDEIINFINKERKRLENIEIYKDNKALLNTTIELFNLYQLELSKAVPVLIEIIEAEDVNEKDIDRLNEYYPQMNKNLDVILNNFYSQAEDYANKYDIGLE